MLQVDTCAIHYPKQSIYLLHPVVLTGPNVTIDLFPPGARAILGYGVSIPNSGLIDKFLA